jgi:hypothetical protein
VDGSPRRVITYMSNGIFDNNADVTEANMSMRSRGRAFLNKL